MSICEATIIKNKRCTRYARRNGLCNIHAKIETEYEMFDPNVISFSVVAPDGGKVAFKASKDTLLWNVFVAYCERQAVDVRCMYFSLFPILNGHCISCLSSSVVSGAASSQHTLGSIEMHNGDRIYAAIRPATYVSHT